MQASRVLPGFLLTTAACAFDATGIAATDAGPSPDAPRLAAPTGYVGSDVTGRWYRHVSAAASIVDAHADCADDHADADLLVIDDARENAELVRTIDAQLDGQRVWIGITDLRREGAWQTLDGAPLRFGAWEAGEPNDAGAGEDCAVVLGRFDPDDARGRWADAACDQRRPYVCEWSPPDAWR